MEGYYFLYKNALGNWHGAINPVFIAQHTYCRAIPKDLVKSLGYSFIGDLCFSININEVSPTTLEALAEYDIHI